MNWLFFKDVLRLALRYIGLSDYLANPRPEDKDPFTEALYRLDEIRRRKNLEDLEDLEDVISQLQLCAEREEVPEVDPKRLSILANLGVGFHLRFDLLENIGDLQHAISQLRIAVNLGSNGHPGMHIWLFNLGSSLYSRFKHLGDDRDIDEAVERFQAAVKLSTGHPHKAFQLSGLGLALSTRFEHFGNADDINKAIEYQQAASNLCPDDYPDRYQLLGLLGDSLRIRFERFGDADDIQRSAGLHQTAVKLYPDGDNCKCSCLVDLGSSLRARFERFGNISDIDEAVEYHRAAVDLSRDTPIGKAWSLNNLGHSLSGKLQFSENIEYIDTGVELHQAAVDLCPDGHPFMPLFLGNLGTSLVSRFKRFGNVEDIHRAIEIHQIAVKTTPDASPATPGRLIRLGGALQARFERFKSPQDIQKAVELQQRAVDLSPDDHPRKPSHLHNLGTALVARYKHSKSIEDIDKAVDQYQAALNLSPDDHPNKPRWMNNLGHALQRRSLHFTDAEDFDKAIEQHKKALDLTVSGHPEYSSRLFDLGTSFLTRYAQNSDMSDIEAAIEQCSAAAEISTASPSIRFPAANGWIGAAALIQHPSLLAAYECAISIIPHLAWLGLSISNRHQHLTRIGSIARDAAAKAIALQQYDKAIEWLEQGRSIVWNQILQLRTPVDQLRGVDSELADRLMHLSRLLDSGSQQGDSEGGNYLFRDREEGGRRYRALAAQWETSIEKVRELPGFGDFLRPPRLSRLLGAANEGPVIVLNIAEERCDALALIDGIDRPVHIPLPSFTLDKAMKLQDDLTDLLKSSNVRIRAVRILDPERDGDGGCRRILAELWNCVVKSVLDSLAFSPHPDKLPRIWWCVTGPLAFLPIHAAGIYDDESGDEQLSNYVISSYIPTLSALLESNKPTSDTPFEMLSVIEPSTGRWYIPNTVKELEHIRRHLGTRNHVVLESSEATKQRALKAMKNCNWLHLACHGSQNAKNPTKSGLKLRDGDLTLEEIIKLDLPQAEFAFLSACQTTTGEEKLSEESVHIAGGMLLAGYQSVVATMWSIEDKLAPEVADEFYSHLMGGEGRPDSRKTA